MGAAVGVSVVGMVHKTLAQTFPGLPGCGYTLASPPTRAYNCAAWAAGENARWWWPDALGIWYWPPTVPREETVDAFAAAYGELGYERCADDSFEPGFQKIAIYTEAGIPQHVARQTKAGKWTSKLGREVDIDHNTLDGLVSPLYGRPTCFLKRPRND